MNAQKDSFLQEIWKVVLSKGNIAESIASSADSLEDAGSTGTIANEDVDGPRRSKRKGKGKGPSRKPKRKNKEKVVGKQYSMSQDVKDLVELLKKEGKCASTIKGKTLNGKVYGSKRYMSCCLFLLKLGRNEALCCKCKDTICVLQGHM